MSDEQQEDLGTKRGFPPIKRRIILRKGNTVYFGGSEYRVIADGQVPILEKVITERKGNEG